MRTYIPAAACLLLMSCASSLPKEKTENKYLVKFQQAEESGYLNQAGDTIVPAGKYAFCFSDTIQDLGMVAENETGKILGIDKNAGVLFEVFNFDNGPDYPQDGLFRIVKDGKFGYADMKGRIVIEPKFACAFPFENGTAKVADDCLIIPEQEHSSWASANWYHIDKEGKPAGKP